MRDEKEAAGVQSAEVALLVLRVLAEGGGEMPLSRLAAACGMPPAKVHRYVVSLMRAGFVEQAGRSSAYSLGGEALRVGLVALARLDIIDLGTEVAGELRDRTGQTVLLAIWSDNGPTIVRWFETLRPVTVNVRVGSIMPLLGSATGQVFGAWMPWEQIRSLVEAELVGPGAPVITVAEARGLFAGVRKAELAIVSGTMLPGIQALGAPVLNAGGGLAAAITVLGTVGSFDPSPDGVVADELRAAAGGLSHRLGCAQA